MLTFYGASSGYRFTFMGKKGESSPAEMFTRAGLRAGQSLLIVYGPGADDGIVDRVAIEAIEVGVPARRANCGAGRHGATARVCELAGLWGAGERRGEP